MPKNTRISEKTIQSPEFINLQPLEINPLMSACEVKVLYVGQNRNGSFIDKATATKMSKTLRGCPIAGWFIEDKQDFGDHGERLTIDGNGARFEKLTRPYGFIPTDAKVWFQFFEDQDEFGNTCVREYLMCQAFLWTGQFPECADVIDNQNPQSMELDKDSLKGHWATNNNTGMEFFIINDAIFSELCILGNDVEPCFEGSQFLTPDTSSNFSMNKEFMTELYSMMKELKFALNNQKGGLSMDNIEQVQANENLEEFSAETVEVEAEATETPQTENFENNQDELEQSSIAENENNIEDYAKNDEKKEEEDKKETSDDAKEDAKEEEKDASDEEEKKEEPKKDHSLVEEEVNVEELQNSLAELQNQFSLLQAENAELKAFKKQIEDEKKDELIASFYMLTDEDKKEVINNKDNYSLDDIKKELSVICVDKKVNFNLNDDSEEDKTADVTVNFSDVNTSMLPPWLQAVENVKKSLYN